MGIPPGNSVAVCKFWTALRLDSVRCRTYLSKVACRAKRTYRAYWNFLSGAGTCVQPCRRISLPCVCTITVPAPVLRALDHFFSNWVQAYVAAHFEKIRVFIHQHSLEAPLKQMPYLAVATVLTKSVDAIEVPHQARKIRAVGLHNSMIIITHQAISIGCSLKPIQRLSKQFQSGATVFVVLEHRLAAVTGY